MVLSHLYADTLASAHQHLELIGDGLARHATALDCTADTYAGADAGSAERMRQA